MGITGVGSSYNFVYNTKTGKLSTKDGSKNEFVDFCNGDVKGEDTESLNHFDAHTRYQFQRMLYVYGTGMIHFADQQYFSSMTDTYTDYILEFLSSQGVDTSREFVINGTHCELVNGKIREVGNDYVVPSAIQQKAVKRYEERMAQLLKDGNWYRMA